jgi:hypothetical protein
LATHSKQHAFIGNLMLYLAYGMNTNNNQMNPAAQRLGPALLEGFAW